MPGRLRIGNFLPEREDHSLFDHDRRIIFPSGKMTAKVTRADEIGRLVRRRRREIGLSQIDLAGVARVTPRLVGELENGKKTAQLDGVLRVLAALGLDLYVKSR